MVNWQFKLDLSICFQLVNLKWHPSYPEQTPKICKDFQDDALNAASKIIIFE